MSKTQQQGMNPPIPPMDGAQEPTHGKLDHRTMIILAKDWRTDNQLLENSGHFSVSSKNGQDELMGSIRCTWIPFILIVTGQSHCLPLLRPYSVNPQVDPKTHTSTNTIVLFICHDSHDPLCL